MYFRNVRENLKLSALLGHLSVSVQVILLFLRILERCAVEIAKNWFAQLYRPNIYI